MTVEILTEKFKKALSVLERVTRKITTLPALQNVLIKTEGNFLELTTTNLETTIRWWILAKIDNSKTLMVPATFLSNLVSLISAEKIKLEEENQNLVLITENQRTQLQGQNPEDFPIIPKLEKENSFTLSVSKLASALQQITDVPAISQVRPEISGVFFNLKKKTLKIVGTDSFRLAEKTIELEEEVSKEISFILPQGTARELLNVASQEQQGKVVIYPSTNQALFEFFNEEANHCRIQVLSRLIDGQYPNYQEIIPKKHTTTITIKKEELESQIKKAGLFSGKVAEVKLKTLPEEGKLKIFSQSAERGSNKSFSICQIEGDELEVSFNYKFLADGLTKLRSSEVILELSGTEGPGVLKPVGDTSYLYILMPIKAT